MKFTKYIISFAFLAIGIASFTSCDKISGIFDRSTPTEETVSKAEYDKLQVEYDSLNEHYTEVCKEYDLLDAENKALKNKLDEIKKIVEE